MKRFASILAWLFMFAPLVAAAQQKENADSLVRLIEAKSGHLQEIDGVSYRKFIGPARFLHNDTYLLCDTALWNVNTNRINAIGHVQIIQENTILMSDEIEYIVDENLAQFRGNVVELFDKEGNILKTRHLDYNTKDSIAVFYNGGALKNADGNLIESINGSYHSKEKLFSFSDNVQMFTDSVFVKSDEADYRTDLNKAFFGRGTTAWQGENILYADSGDYDRNNDIFVFDKNSYVLTPEQEIWSDTLTYFRRSGIADLYHNIQILDTVQSAICLGDRGNYRPSPMEVIMTREPALAVYTVENGVKDTLFVSADTLKYYTVRYGDIDTNEIALARERKRLAEMDPLAVEEKPAGKQDPAMLPEKDTTVIGAENILSGKEGTDSVSVVSAVDSLALSPVSPPPADTAQIAYIRMFHHVKMYRSDLQGLCDSLVYTGLDSITRFYKDPVMWNDVKNQFVSDSMQAIIKNRALNKVNLISNAFIATQEDSIHFNQVKSTEMTAFFRDNDLYRFDALGGASAIFYLEEDSVITIMNQKESKILSASIQERKLQRVKYVEQIKSDAYPIYNLPLSDQRLRDFNWRGDERPVTRYEVTGRTIRPSLRTKFENARLPVYPQTEIYFKEKRDSIMRYRAEIDSLRSVRFQNREKARSERVGRESGPESDSLSVTGTDADVARTDLLRDSSGREAAAAPDSLAAGTDAGREKVKDKAVGKRKNKKVKSRRSGKMVTVILQGEEVTMTRQEYKAYKKELRKREKKERKERRRARRD